MAEARPPPVDQANPLLSRQVSGSRYFFLNLAGVGRGRNRGQLALGGREHCNPDYAIDRRDFSYAILEYVAEGRGWAELDGRRYELTPGALFLCPRTTACVMRTAPERPMVKYFLCLAGSGAVRRLNAAGLRAGDVRALAAHGEIRSVFEDLIREGGHASPRTAEICAVLFDLLVLKLEDGIAQSARPSELARDNFLRCKALIDSHAEKFSSLHDIAAAAGLDVSSVCRLFRRYQGGSPYQYLLRRKMNLAAEFLVQSGGLVKEAALRIGFSDPYHFSRCFKATHGVAPSELRRRRASQLPRDRSVDSPLAD
jgi:AraC family transcriptional regulator